MGFLSGILGGGDSGPSISLPASTGSISVAPLANAKGNAFDRYGVIDRPAAFSYGGGQRATVAETAPEAIMPLTRLPNGSLGVAAASQNGGGGGKTSVTINNYSGQQVQTQETQDGHGNRELKVLVGEMVAQESGRPGSSMSRRLRGDYGAQPVLKRR